MTQARFFSHVDPRFGKPAQRLTRAGIRWKSCAENIHRSRGHSDPVRVALNGWLNSPGHRKNILDTTYTQTGVGVTVSAGGVYTITQLFVDY
jgi:uncharacterized protein YkwD